MIDLEGVERLRLDAMDEFGEGYEEVYNYIPKLCYAITDLITELRAARAVVYAGDHVIEYAGEDHSFLRKTLTAYYETVKGKP